MPDIRTLLDEATARPPHPAPVAAVHARVRRRAARRRAAVAAGAAAAVTATGTVAAGLAAGGRPERVADYPEPTATWLRVDTTWRHATPPVIVSGGARGTVWETRLPRLVAANEDAILGYAVSGEYDERRYTIAFGADVDPEQWRDRLDAAAGRGRWTAQRCPETARRMDAIAAEVWLTRWPSGDHPREYAYRDVYAAFSLGWPCSVRVEMSGDDVRPEDAAYARARWGDAVRLVGRGARADETVRRFEPAT